MVRFVNAHFVPVKIHIKERPKDFERFKAEWTPTTIIAEPDGTERYRFTGFLPVDEFLAQLRLGLAKAAFGRGRFGEAQRAFQEVTERHPQSDAAPEALYWAGVSEYKSTGRPEPLARGGAELQQKYPGSVWAKKGSVWMH